MTNGKGDKRRTSEDGDKYRSSFERIFADPPKDDSEEKDEK
jgi:hypothetical protein